MTDTPEQTIIIYGTTWCGDCRRSVDFLNFNQIQFQWIDIDKDKEARVYVEKVNNGYRSVPTILFPDGSILVEPSLNELRKKLEL